MTSWSVAHHAPLSMGFSRQEYWSGLPFPPPGDLLDPGIKPGSSALQVDLLPSEPRGKPHGIAAKRMQVCMSTYNISDIVLYSFHNYVSTEESIFVLLLFREKIQGRDMATVPSASALPAIK